MRTHPTICNKRSKSKPVFRFVLMSAGNIHWVIHRVIMLSWCDASFAVTASSHTRIATAQQRSKQASTGCCEAARREPVDKKTVSSNSRINAGITSNCAIQVCMAWRTRKTTSCSDKVFQSSTTGARSTKQGRWQALVTRRCATSLG